MHSLASVWVVLLLMLTNPRLATGQCAAGTGCTDSTTWNGGLGLCSSYALTVNTNNGYCVEDGACSPCACQCANKCPTLCSNCPSDTYKDNANYEPCSICPAGTTSTAGSTSLSQCTPIICAANQYSTGYGNNPRVSITRSGTACSYGSFTNIENSATLSGTFEDGSGESDYPANVNCVFTISLSTTAQITVESTFMSTEADSDVITVNHMTYSGTWPWSRTYTAQSLQFTWTTDASVNGKGWTVRYTVVSAACAACPDFSSSSAESSGITNCVCNPGYIGDNGGACTICGAGTYKLGVSPGSCASCPASSTSPPGSTSSSACVRTGCDAGYTGDPCAACEAGTYKATDDDAACSSCPANAEPNSASGATGCLCVRGYAGADAASCAACPQGKYSDTYPAVTCSDCPVNTNTAGSASDSESSCVCLPGFQEKGGVCGACPVGFFKGGLSSTQSCTACGPGGTTAQDRSTHPSQCLPGPGYTLLGENSFQACDLNTYKASSVAEACTPCPAGATTTGVASTSFSACNCTQEGYRNRRDLVQECGCAPGFRQLEGGTGGVFTCEPCAANSWCPGSNLAGPNTGQQGSQQACHLNSQSLSGSSSVSDCKCNSGYSGSEGGVTCQACGSNTFKAGVGNTLCTSCAEYSNSPTASTSASDCLCNAGYTGSNGVNCTSCAGGTYKISAEACQDCPVDSDSPPASSSAAACFCNAGYTGGNGESCTACPLDQYKADTGSGACSTCPPLSTAPLASTTQSACRCNAGYTGPDGGTCEACPAATYKTVVGASQSLCESCPANSTSPAGSNELTDCQCNAGYTGPDGGTCTVCPVNTYKAATGSAACSSCPALSTSPSGSTALGACSCPLGYTGADGGPCTGCVVGTFKSITGSANCTICPANSNSPSVSTSASACLCNAGYTGPNGGNCTACTMTQYKAGPGNSACSSCPSQSAGPVASITLVACLCNAGYTGPNGGNCTACGVGTYKAAIGSTACRSCPSGRGSQEIASTNPISCLCNAGSTGPNTCTVCKYLQLRFAHGNIPLGGAAEWYTDYGVVYNNKPVWSNNVAYGARFMFSPANFKTGWVVHKDFRENAHGIIVSNTDANGNVVDISGIEVPIGVMWKDFSYTGTGRYVNEFVAYPPDTTCLRQCTCTTCDVGTYKAGAGSAACVSCPADSTSLADRSACLCNVGYTGSNSGPCTRCVAGQYKNTTGSAACSTCPALSTSPPGSDAQGDCQCVPGYTGPDGGLCTICGEGEYKNTTGSEACSPCTRFSSSPPGSTSLWNCSCREDLKGDGSIGCHKECPAGFEDIDGQCVGCQTSFYKPDFGDHACTRCPEFAHMTEGTRNQTSNALCVCEIGLVWQNETETCQQCTDCVCNAHSSLTLIGGGKKRHECVCHAGYHRLQIIQTNSNVTCSPCLEHHYCPDQTAEIQCPSRTHSPAGSIALANCSCVAGLFGPPEACVVCPVNTYCEGGLEYRHCPLNSSTHGLQQRNSSRDCECLSGFHRVNETCEECLSGSFCFDDTMFRCPRNASSPKGSSACTCDPDFKALAVETGKLECEACPPQLVCPGGGAAVEVCASGALNRGGECVCEEGSACHGRNNLFSCSGGATCASCPQNKYCSQNSAFSCPPHSSSPVNSSSLLACVCDPGYYRVNDTCVACEVGSWCHDQQQNFCVDSDSSLIGTLPLMSTRKEACVCKRGYFRLSQDDTCKPCPQDFWCPLAAPSDPLPNVFACMQYGYTLNAASYRFEQCLCDAGLKFSTVGMTTVCVPCAKGQRCQDGEVVEEFCHLQQRTADSEHKNCVCLPGFSEDSTRTCIPCAVGTVKPDAGNGACVTCPTDSIPLNSTHCEPCPASSHVEPGITVCTCERPLFWTGSIGSSCAPCAVDHYFESPEATNEVSRACKLCPPHSSTANTTGNAGIDSCRCLPGYVRDSESQVFCKPCPEATYEEGGVCRSCGTGAHSPATSTSSGACVCNTTRCQRYIWNDDCFGSCEDPPPPCSPCLPGHKKDFFSYVGNTDDCARCDINTYQPASAATSCIACHETRENLHTGMSNVTACVCRAGYEPVLGEDASTGNASEACAPCRLGFFKSLAGNTACQPCPIGQFSNVTTSSTCTLCAHVVSELGVLGATTTPESASTSIANCTCLQGHYREGGLCAACVTGKYKTDKSFEECSRCGTAALIHHYGRNETGASSSEHCLQCPMFSGNDEGLVDSGLIMDSISKCLCFAGHDTWSTEACERCDNYTYKTGYSNTDCESCEADSYWININQPCIMCSLASSDGAAVHSVAFNARNHSVRWGQTEQDCACRVGYERIHDQCHQCLEGYYRGQPEFAAGIRSCTECGPDHFQPEKGTEECLECPSHSSFNGTGAIRSQDCLCDDGYYWVDGICDPCPAGTWKKWSADMSVAENMAACSLCAPDTYSLGTASECTPCAENMFSAEGADSFEKCFCDAGFGVILDPGACEPCPNATYWGGEATPRRMCALCPKNKTSPVGSDAEADCRCVPGHGIEMDSPPSEPCVACLSGSFALGGNQPCESCGWGAVSEPASEHPESCMCDAGSGLIESN